MDRIIKPGLLVALRTRILGGVEYGRRDLPPPEHSDGADVARWETTRTIDDLAAWEAAKTVRSAAAAAVRRACIVSDFGLLCPADREEKLDEGTAEARKLVQDHNATEAGDKAKVEVFVLKGRMAASDVEAATAVASEIRDLIQDMDQGVGLGDVEKIREAASRARSLGAMLEPDAASKVAAAVDEARAAARALVKRAVKGGEDVARVVQDLRRKDLDAARFAFLDLGSGPQVQSAQVRAPELDIPAAGGEASSAL